MKKAILPFAILVLGCLLMGGAAHADFVPEEGTLLLTYPRSGTNWTIGILQAKCQRPVRFLDHPDLTNCLGVNRLRFKIDNRLPVIYRSHSVTDQVKEINQPSFSLILTLRNYKECIVKENQFTAERFLIAVLKNEKCVSQYFRNLEFFESEWKNPETKHLIVYEEILSNPRKVVISLLTFLGEDISGVPEFFEHYDDWNEAMLASYHKQHAKKGPASNNDPLYHSKDFPKKLLIQVDAIIKKRYPHLWDKYLKRYAETQ